MDYRMIGIDPGVKDTGVVELVLYPEAQQFGVRYHVYSGAVLGSKQEIRTDPEVLRHMKQSIAVFNGETLIGVEGYRPRGKNSDLDRKMTVLVNDIHVALDATVVDNTGIRQVVSTDLLKCLHMSRFPATNHADLKSAARVAVMMGLKDPEINYALVELCLGYLDGEPWQQM